MLFLELMITLGGTDLPPTLCSEALTLRDPALPLTVSCPIFKRVFWSMARTLHKYDLVDCFPP